MCVFAEDTQTRKTGEKMVIERVANIKGAAFKATENDTLSPLLNSLTSHDYTVTLLAFLRSFTVFVLSAFFPPVVSEKV